MSVSSSYALSRLSHLILTIITWDKPYYSPLEISRLGLRKVHLSLQVHTIWQENQIKSDLNLKIFATGAGEITQWSRVLITLPEDQGSVPNTQMSASNSLELQHLTPSHRHTWRQNFHAHILKSFPLYFSPFVSWAHITDDTSENKHRLQFMFPITMRASSKSCEQWQQRREEVQGYVGPLSSTS